MSNAPALPKRSAVIVVIQLLIAAMHILRLGSRLQGELYNFYYSYFSDSVLPFGFYFLLCADEQWLPFIRRWQAKLALAFLAPSVAETCQYFGIAVLGSTFDPLDYLMYGLGALAAVLVDIQVFPRAFSFWSREKPSQ